MWLSIRGKMHCFVIMKLDLVSMVADSVLWLSVEHLLSWCFKQLNCSTDNVLAMIFLCLRISSISLSEVIMKMSGNKNI